MATTELAVRDASNFVALATDLSAVQEAIEVNLDGADLTPFDLTRITVPSGRATTYRWEVPTLDGSEVREELRGIIIYKQTQRAWWPKSLDEGGGGIPPSCSSADGRTGFGKQWATAADPDPQDQPPRQLVCKQCPHAQFGSDGRGQACKQSEQLFLLMETGFLPAVISAPAMSLAPFKRYMVGLSNQGLVYNQIETILGLERATNAGQIDFARITFKRGAHLDDDARARARAYADSLRPQFEAVARENGAAAPSTADLSDEPMPGEPGTDQPAEATAA